MKLSALKILLVLTVISSISIIGVAIYQSMFSLKTQITYKWGTQLLDEQTVRILCGKLTLYYRSSQNPQTSTPVGYQEEPIDNRFCANEGTMQARFPYLTSPDHQCQPVSDDTWRCQNDMVKALWKRQASKQ